MPALERIMRAYAKKYPLNPDQALIVRRELSRIIDELLKRPRRAPIMLPEGADDVRRGSAPGSAPDVAVRVATGPL
jgi:hypothetical protein